MTDLGLELRAMRDSDRHYVLSSWLRSYSGKSRDARDYASPHAFAKDYVLVVRALVERSQIIIASLREEPDVIVGWAAIEGDVVHYVLTKPRWRQLGVATWLLQDFAKLPVAYTHRTSDALRCKIPEAWVYRRFRIWPADKEAA